MPGTEATMASRSCRALWVTALVASVALLFGCGEPASHPRGATPRKTVVESYPEQGMSKQRVARRSPSPEIRPVPPVSVRIPAIGVNAPVIRLGLNLDRSLEVPEDWGETGRWSGGAKPGKNGPAVIVGHVDSKSGPAVFFRLRELRRGDEISLSGRSGKRVVFEVLRLERHPKNDFPTDEVYGSSRLPTLRLITCDGDFDESTGRYVDNLIVFARIIE
jgi:sortase (surface protein transpeptidase)